MLLTRSTWLLRKILFWINKLAIKNKHFVNRNISTTPNTTKFFCTLFKLIQYTEVRLASFFSGDFTTMAVINPPEKNWKNAPLCSSLIWSPWVAWHRKIKIWTEEKKLFSNENEVFKPQTSIFSTKLNFFSSGSNFDFFFEATQIWIVYKNFWLC